MLEAISSIVLMPVERIKGLLSLPNLWRKGLVIISPDGSLYLGRFKEIRNSKLSISKADDRKSIF